MVYSYSSYLLARKITSCALSFISSGKHGPTVGQPRRYRADLQRRNTFLLSPKKEGLENKHVTTEGLNL